LDVHQFIPEKDHIIFDNPPYPQTFLFHISSYFHMVPPPNLLANSPAFVGFTSFEGEKNISQALLMNSASQNRG
jgi:hypothetical protein